MGAVSDGRPQGETSQIITENVEITLQITDSYTSRVWRCYRAVKEKVSGWYGRSGTAGSDHLYTCGHAPPS